MNRIIVIVAILGFVLNGSHALAGAADPFIGAWAMKMPDGKAGWLNIERTDEGLRGELWTVGQSKPLSKIELKGDRLSFVRNVKIGEPPYPGGPPQGDRVPCPHEATVSGDKMLVSMTAAHPDRPHYTIAFTGKKMPPLPPRPDLSEVKFGKPIELFNGKNLDGWKMRNPAKLNGWKAVDGVLVNETPKLDFSAFGEYGNLHTEKFFDDFELSIEFNVPPGGNSGIYLRGVYEAQVVDRDSRMQGLQGVGAIFSRIPPSEKAGKPGGQWQHYLLTLVDRHITVVLNGKKVIDNQPLPGATNGAFQADETVPGPIYLQGDHTSVRYRNIVLRPVIGKK
ncbi:MAG: 3-keto-disaccharide hydrolase [Planctomycetota bacterium]|jgi:hypothetical protein